VSGCALIELNTGTTLAMLNAVDTAMYTILNGSSYSIACFVTDNADLIMMFLGNGEEFMQVVTESTFYWAQGDVGGTPNPVDYLADVTTLNKSINVTVSFEGRTCASFQQLLEASL